MMRVEGERECKGVGLKGGVFLYTGWMCVYGLHVEIRISDGVGIFLQTEIPKTWKAKHQMKLLKLLDLGFNRY